MLGDQNSAKSGMGGVTLGQKSNLPGIEETDESNLSRDGLESHK